MTAFRDPETGNAFRRINGREVHFLTTARTSHLSHSWWLEAMRNPLGDTRNLVYVVPQNDVNRFVLVFVHNDNTNTYTFWMRVDETFGVWQCIEWEGEMTFAEAEEHVNTHFITAARNDAMTRYSIPIE